MGRFWFAVDLLDTADNMINRKTASRNRSSKVMGDTRGLEVLYLLVFISLGMHWVVLILGLPMGFCISCKPCSVVVVEAYERQGRERVYLYENLFAWNDNSDSFVYELLVGLVGFSSGRVRAWGLAKQTPSFLAQ